MFLTAIGLVAILLLTIGFFGVRAALHQGSLFRRLQQGTLSLLCLGVGLLTGGLWLALRSFEAFARTTVVAQVQCKWVGPKEFDLTLTPVRGGLAGAVRTVRLRGDQWAVSGGIVKWHPWLTALGVPSYHKLTRISGRYAKTADEVAAAPTAVALSEEPDAVWWWLYRFDPWLPFVDATYGSAAFIYVNPTLIGEVSVAPSGYLIRQIRPTRANLSG